MADPHVRVLFIAGWGRSGTTLLGNILGQSVAAVQGGELMYAWNRGVMEDRLCGCGERFRDCPFWREVFDRAFGGMDKANAEAVTDQRRAAMSSFRLLGHRVPAVRRAILAKAQPLTEPLGKLYRAVADTAGAEVVIDTSKFPSYGFILGHHPDIDLRTVHVVRDPRAVAYSWWKRNKVFDGEGSTQRIGKQDPLRSALRWNMWNQVLRDVWRREGWAYELVRYERFVERPRTVSREIAELAGLDPDALTFTAEDAVALDPCHSVSGNPNRFHTGPVHIRGDEEWRAKLDRRTQTMISLATAWHRPTYGY